MKTLVLTAFVFGLYYGYLRVMTEAQQAAVDTYDKAAGRFYALAEIERQKGHVVLAARLREKARVAEVAAKRERFDV
jgi:hypothetical protein